MDNVKVLEKIIKKKDDFYLEIGKIIDIKNPKKKMLESHRILYLQRQV